MSILIGLLLFLAQVLGLPFEVFEDGSGYIDVVPPTETRWCGAGWSDIGGNNTRDDELWIGCFEYEPYENSVA